MTDDHASPSVPYTWKVLLGAMVIDRRKLLEHDPGHHHDTLPQVRLGEPELSDFEAELGLPLPTGLRGFLRHADGWPGAWRDLGLFGRAELLGRDNGEAAAQLLERYDRAGALAHAGLAPAEVLAVAAGPPDHLVLTSRQTGETVWFAGGRARERFDDYPLFVLELLNLQRDRLEALAEDKPAADLKR